MGSAAEVLSSPTMTDQRYYNQQGAFWSPDPGGIGTADITKPTTWNRYAYTDGDPINFNDPAGLFTVSVSIAGFTWSGADTGSCKSFFMGLATYAPTLLGSGGIQAINNVCMNVPMIVSAAELATAAAANSGPVEPTAPRIPRLVVRSDCYWANGTGYISGWTRVITYQVVDQDGKPFFGSDVPTVQEQVTPTGGVKITGNGVWKRSDNSMSPDGTFSDFLSSNGQGTATADQTFSVSGTAVHVAIGQGDPTVLPNTYTNSGVTVNGTTSPRPCKQGDPVAR